MAGRILQKLEAHQVFQSVLDQRATDSDEADETYQETGTGTVLGSRNHIALAGHELFVLVNNEIRHVRLTSLLSDEEEQSVSSFRRIRLRNVDFPVHRILLSPNKKKLALLGSHSVAWVSTSDDTDAIMIGGGITHASPVDVKWHPLSRSSQSLMVLYDDGYLRLFELDVSCDMPDYEIQVSPRARSAQHGYGSYTLSDEYTPSSFALGRNMANGWGPLAVRVAMQNGDIYTICPVLPASSLVPSAFVTTLANLCHVLQQESSDERQKRLQVRWISDILGQVRLANEFGLDTGGKSLWSIEGVDDDHQFSLLHRPLAINKSLAIQGPAVFDPPGAYDEEEDTDPSTETVVFAAGISPIDILLVAGSNGAIDVCLDIQDVKTCWRPYEEAQLPQLAVYETIVLPHKDELPQFVSDRTNPEKIYALYSSAVYVLDMQSWLHSLNNCLGQGEENLSEFFSSSPEATAVSRLIDSNPLRSSRYDHITGFAVLMDPFFGHFSISVTESGAVQAQRLGGNQSAADDITEERAGSSESEDEQISPGHIPAYTSLLPRPIYQAPVRSSSAGQTRIIVPQELRSVSAPNPEYLRFLGTSVEQVRQRLKEGYNDLRTLCLRVELQTKETSRQIEKAGEAESRLDKLATAKERNTERISKVTERNKELQAQANSILQRLITASSPALSDEEKKWQSELQRLQQRVNGVQGYGMRAKAIQEALQALQNKEIQSAAKEPHVYGSPARIKQQQQLKEYLDRQTQLLSATKARVRKLARLVEDAPLEE